MKTQYYKGWRIYRTSGGCNNRLAQLNGKHPLRGTKITSTIPDDGNQRKAMEWIKRDIDAIEAGGA